MIQEARQKIDCCKCQGNLFVFFLSALVWLVIGFVGLAFAENVEVFVKLGHTSKVNAVAISSDGRYAASGGSDKVLRLWDVSTGNEIETLKGNTAIVNSVCFSPDGRYILSGSWDKTLKLWDVTTGKQIRTFRGHTKGVSSVAFSPDGKYALSGSYYNGSVKLWDISSGEELRKFKGHRHGIESVAFSSDGKYALSGGGSSDNKDCTVRLWDVSTGKEVRIFKGHARLITSVTFSPDGKYVLSGSIDKTIRLWETSTGRELKTFTGHSDWVESVAFSPDGRHFISASGGWHGKDNSIKLWSVSTGREVKSFKGHSAQVNSVVFSPDGRFILSGSTDSTLKLWDVTTGDDIRSFGLEPLRCDKSIFSPDGRHVFSATQDGVALWEFSTGKRVKMFFTGYPVGSFALTHDGRRVVVSERMREQKQSRVSVWDISAGRKVETSILHTGKCLYLRLTPNGDRALSVHYDETLHIWDVATGKHVRKISTGNSARLWLPTFSPNGKHVLIGDNEGRLNMWDISTGTHIKTFHSRSSMPVIYTVISPNGKYALSTRGAGLTLWDINTGKDLTRFPVVFKSNAVAFSPCGEYALSGADYSGTAKLWKISSGELVKEFGGHGIQVYLPAFSPDGKFVLTTGGSDGTIRVWNPWEGKEIVRMIGFRDNEWVTMTPEGYFDASTNGPKHISVKQGSSIYSIDHFIDRFFNPMLVAQVLQGKEVKVENNIADGFETPPEVRIVSPRPGESFNAETINVLVQARDMGGGIDEIRLYHNGKVVGDELKRALKIIKKKGIESKDFQLTLLEGQNRLRAVAFSRDRTESNPYELIVRLTAPSKQVTLNLLVVGINKYKNSDLNLNYAENDARGITRFFKSKGKSLFKNIKVTELYNENATGQSIKAAFEALQDTEAQDVVVIYLAGHGETVKDKWYFIPHEVIYPEREGEVVAKGISSDDISQYIKDVEARKVLMLMDSCKAGAAIEVAFRGAEDRRALMQLARATGIYVVAASTKSQFAAEVKELGHGVFTHTLLNGLNGAAAPGDQKTVTVRRLMSFVEERLPEISRKYRREAQYPVVYSRGMDFPLAVK